MMMLMMMCDPMFQAHAPCGLTFGPSLLTGSALSFTLEDRGQVLITD